MFQLGMKSSAYHPQSQGTLERFYQTLKSMIQVYYFQEKDWNEGILLPLFAMREAIATVEFEIVFGHTPGGPLKLSKLRVFSLVFLKSIYAAEGKQVC